MNPIVILWAHPRSMSTAIERIMRERGDFDCLHEPFLHYYYRRGGFPHFERDADHPDSYEGVRDLILEKAEQGPVFAKDMSYYVMPEILDDREFCARISNCFLVRNPVHAILSYFRLDPTVSLEEIGLESQWQHLQGLDEAGISPLPIIEAEQVQADPVGAMRRFWKALSLEDRPGALDWEASSTPEDWVHVSGWHTRASESRGIDAPDDNANAERQRKFDALCQEHPAAADYLAHHLPFYQKLLRHGGQDV